MMMLPAKRNSPRKLKSILDQKTKAVRERKTAKVAAHATHTIKPMPTQPSRLPVFCAHCSAAYWCAAQTEPTKTDSHKVKPPRRYTAESVGHGRQGRSRRRKRGRRKMRGVRRKEV